MRKIFVVSLLLATRLSAADDSLPRKVDGYLAPLVKSRELNAVVLIARGDKPVVQRAYGMGDFELNKALDAGARFRIASITKTFTSAAALMLIERGRSESAAPAVQRRHAR